MSAKAATGATPTPLSSAAAAAVIPLHLVPENQMQPVIRRTHTTTRPELIIPGPVFSARQVADTIAEAEAAEKLHPAEIQLRVEGGPDGRPQLVVFYVQETTS